MSIESSSADRGTIMLEASKGILFLRLKHSSGAAVGADKEAVVTRTSRYAAYMVGEVLIRCQIVITTQFIILTHNLTPNSVQYDPDRTITLGLSV